jgi:hypothetical protein
VEQFFKGDVFRGVRRPVSTTMIGLAPPTAEVQLGREPIPAAAALEAIHAIGRFKTTPCDPTRQSMPNDYLGER